MQRSITEKPFLFGFRLHNNKLRLDLPGDYFIAVGDVFDESFFVRAEGLLTLFQDFLGCMLLDVPEIILRGVIRERYSLAVDGITLFAQRGEKPPFHCKIGWDAIVRYRQPDGSLILCEFG